MAKTNKPLDLIEATKAQAAARHKARYDELVALMRRRMAEIVERFYDLGEALREMLETRRYTAGGHTSLRAFLAAEGLVSYAKANRLIAIVRKVPRARALYCAATSRAPLQSFRVVQQRFCVHSGGAGWQRQSGPTHDKHT